jgi:hypothetical protein
MNDNLYFVENQGCDATTYGLARLSEDEFPRFKVIIENLNKNSYYGCMPTISVYKISMDDLKEVYYDPKADIWDGNYIDPDHVFYLDGKTYTFVKRYFSYWTELECVIDGG